MSGHELGFMGMAPYLEGRGELIRRAEADCRRGLQNDENGNA